jgi:transposase
MPTTYGKISRKLATRRLSPAPAHANRPIRHDERRYRDRWRVEAVFCRHKDFWRVAIRYDKLAVNYASAVALAVVAFWC